MTGPRKHWFASLYYPAFTRRCRFYSRLATTTCPSIRPRHRFSPIVLATLLHLAVLRLCSWLLPTLSHCPLRCSPQTASGRPSHHQGEFHRISLPLLPSVPFCLAIATLDQTRWGYLASMSIHFFLYKASPTDDQNRISNSLAAPHSLATPLRLPIVVYQRSSTQPLHHNLFTTTSPHPHHNPPQ